MGVILAARLAKSCNHKWHEPTRVIWGKVAKFNLRLDLSRCAGGMDGFVLPGKCRKLFKNFSVLAAISLIAVICAQISEVHPSLPNRPPSVATVHDVCIPTCTVAPLSPSWLSFELEWSSTNLPEQKTAVDVALVIWQCDLDIQVCKDQQCEWQKEGPLRPYVEYCINQQLLIRQIRFFSQVVHNQHFPFWTFTVLSRWT